MLMSPNQSRGPSTATQESVPRLLFLSTSMSPCSTTYISSPGSPSRKSTSPGAASTTSRCSARCSRAAWVKAPNRPMLRRPAVVTVAFSTEPEGPSAISASRGAVTVQFPLNQTGGPTGRLVEGDGAVVARVRDRLETPTPGGARLLLEALVEHLAHTATAIIRVDADQVHVARLGRAWSDEAEQEAHHDAVVLDHACEAAELVEKDRVRQRAGRPSPPTVDDLHDVVVVLLPERSRNHLPSTIPRRWSGWTPSCIEGPCRRPSSSHLPSSVPTLVTWPRRSPTWSPGAPT